jgi:hypothetical protein
MSPHFLYLDADEVRLLFAHPPGQFVEERSPLRAGHPGPGPRVEGGAGGFYGFSGVFKGARCKLGDHLSRGRVVARDGFSRGRIDPLAPDQVFVTPHLRGLRNHNASFATTGSEKSQNPSPGYRPSPARTLPYAVTVRQLDSTLNKIEMN